jgi:ATP-dependent 26S proteasome regulatory subunit
VGTRKYPADEPNKPVQCDPQEWAEALLKFAQPEDETNHTPAFLVLADPAPFLENPGNIRALRESLWRIREAGALKTIILVGGHVPLPEEVAADFWITTYALPTVGELHDIFSTTVKEYKQSEELSGVVFDDPAILAFTRGCAGLPENAARSLFAKAVARFEALDNRAVKLAHDEKEQIVKRSGVAEIQRPRGGLEMVGGLEIFKEYVSEIDDQIGRQEEARKYGCRLPSGILLMGTSGTGKSLVAEALGGHWQLPVLRLDMGSLFGSLVGESEARFRQFKTLANAIRPCVVFCDEFEKGIGGGGGERDGGTSERVKQGLLSWLQEKPDDVIFVATVNSIRPFESNPEILRSGRFDSLWFVDLPDAKSRLEILGIHLKKSGHPITGQDLASVVKITVGFSGAELENIVQTALRRSFREKRNHPAVADLLGAVKTVVPLSVTMGPQLDALRNYVKSGKARPAGALIEDDKKVQQAQVVEGAGTPQLFKK